MCLCRIKKNKEYFTAVADSVNATKASIEVYQKSIVGRDGKKTKMNQANHKMKLTFIGGSSRQETQEQTREQEFSTQSMTQEIMKNINQKGR